MLHNLLSIKNRRIFKTRFLHQITLYDRGLKADMSIYSDVTEALDDDYEGVRIASLKLVVMISQAFAER